MRIPFALNLLYLAVGGGWPALPLYLKICRQREESLISSLHLLP